MRKIVVLNPKGGSGKTTLATNLASYYAGRGLKTALMDHDSQGSSTYWLSRRASEMPTIQSIPAYKQPVGMTRSFFLRVEPATDRLVVDTPAGVDFREFARTLHEADAILVPVLPSDIDIHAASYCIADLLLTAKISRRDERIAVVANRTRKNTLIYQKLTRFLQTLSIPFISTLRDTQNYVRATEQGVGIFDLPAHRVKKDLETWQPVIDWVESRPPQGGGEAGSPSRADGITLLQPQ